MPQESKENINALEGLVDYEGEIDEEYIEPSSGFPPLPPGTHVFTDEKAVFGVTDAGNLQVTLDARGAQQDEIVAGKPLNFIRLSNKPYYRPPQGLRRQEGQQHPPNTSQLLDWLKAKGYEGGLRSLPRLSTPEGRAEMEELIRSVLPRPYRIQHGWQAYCKVCGDAEPDAAKKSKAGTTIPSYGKFPDNGHGGKKWAEVPCPKCGNLLTARDNVMNFFPLAAS
jgi:hypothetical protein